MEGHPRVRDRRRPVPASRRGNLRVAALLGNLPRHRHEGNRRDLGHRRLRRGLRPVAECRHVVRRREGAIPAGVRQRVRPRLLRPPPERATRRRIDDRHAIDGDDGMPPVRRHVIDHLHGVEDAPVRQRRPVHARHANRRVHHKAEAGAPVTGRRRLVVEPTVRGEVIVPAAAATHSVRARGRTLGVFPIRQAPTPVETPFPHIAVQIVEAPRVRQLRPDLMRPRTRVARIPHIGPIRRVAIAVPGRCACAADIFPLRLRRQVEDKPSSRPQLAKKARRVHRVRRGPLRALGRATNIVVRDTFVGLRVTIGPRQGPALHERVLLLRHFKEPHVERLRQRDAVRFVCLIAAHDVRPRRDALQHEFRRLVLQRVEPARRLGIEIGDGIVCGVRATRQVDHAVARTVRDADRAVRNRRRNAVLGHVPRDAMRPVRPRRVASQILRRVDFAVARRRHHERHVGIARHRPADCVLQCQPPRRNRRHLQVADRRLGKGEPGRQGRHGRHCKR